MNPAHTHRAPAHAYRVTLSRNQREIEHEIAPTGERALKVALLMLAKLDALQHGDRLECTETR
jgi:hypothetical protein